MRFSLDDAQAAVQHRLGRAIDLVPPGIASRVTGGPTVVDGQVLDPQLALVRAAEARLYRESDDVTPDERRAAMRLSSRAAAGRPITVGSVRDLTVDGATGPLRARLYAPRVGGDARPLVVFFHGGGWVVGDLDTHDQPCRLLCRYADVNVLSVDYRLAPENPYPAAVDDAVASFAWAAAHAAELGADPSRVAVAGDSAGGNLAAVVSQVTRDAGTTMPVAQLLLYPGTDASRPYPSKTLFANGFFLTKKVMDWYWDTYSAGGSRTDPRLSPLKAASLEGLPPAVVATAAFDPLRDEGEAYAEALQDAGVPVVRRRAAGLVHGFYSMAGIHRASFDESVAVTGAFAALLATSTTVAPKAQTSETTSAP
jgi:acetyl esterase